MIIIFSLLFIYFLIILWFILGTLKKSKAKVSDEPFISVIIAAHNEENNLANCLKALVEQNYPKENYEIIVVNDRSEDQTENIINRWKAQNKLIRSAKISTLPNNYFPKKNALRTGINLSKGDILCFTDADCVPSPNWVKNCSAAFGQGITMVIGLAPLVPANLSKTPLWQLLMVYESWFLAFTSVSAIHNNFPLTCTGRNLGYRKRTFLQLAGFSNISHSLSGDDDLLMHQFQKSGEGRITAITKPDSIVISSTAQTIRHLWRQKTRHFSAGKFYPIEKKVFYLIWNVCNIFITVLPILALCFNFISFTFSLLILLAKLIIDFIFHVVGFKKYKKLSLIKYFLLFEFIYPFYILIVGNVGLLKKPEW